MSKRDEAIYRAALVRQEAGALVAIASGYEVGLADARAEVARLRALLRLATAPLQALLDLQAEVVQCRVCKGGVALCLPHASTLWHIVNVGRTILADTDEALKDAEGSAAERS